MSLPGRPTLSRFSSHQGERSSCLPCLLRGHSVRFFVVAKERLYVRQVHELGCCPASSYFAATHIHHLTGLDSSGPPLSSYQPTLSCHEGGGGVVKHEFSCFPRLYSSFQSQDLRISLCSAFCPSSCFSCFPRRLFHVFIFIFCGARLVSFRFCYLCSSLRRVSVHLILSVFQRQILSQSQAPQRYIILGAFSRLTPSSVRCPRRLH